MKKTFLTAALFATVSLPSPGTTITQWDFEFPVDVILNDSAAGPNMSASTGTGNATGLHASSSTDWSQPTGNGSANSFSSNTWAVGDYYEFSLSTTGYTGIYVGFSATGSSTGPRDFELQYSTTGLNGSFANLATYQTITSAAPNTWNATTPVLPAFYAYDFSAITALDNQATLYFRLVNTTTVSNGGGTVATAGTSRVDDFTVANQAVPPPVPEPTTAVTLVSGLGVLGLLRRRSASA